MKCEGFKLNSYNATYDKAVFDVQEHYSDDKVAVLDITDINTGMTFIIEVRKESKIYEQFNKKNVEKDKSRRAGAGAGAKQAKNLNRRTEQPGFK